ncbi:MAG: hypothetical protein ACI857_002546 [Arenicella sp.]|jgi:hypothetical protein
MKGILFTLILVFTLGGFAQKKAIKWVKIEQYGELIKPKKGVFKIEKAPFTLVFKFKKDIGDLGILADTTDVLDYSKASSGGAFSYGNDYKEMRIWGSKVFTYLPVNKPKEHCFDTLTIKKKWSIGKREVMYFDTEESIMIVEEFPADYLNCVIAKVHFLETGNIGTFPLNFRIELKDIPAKSKYDVKGKSYAGEPGEYKEGCEGCGNPASFKFLKNGTEVEYLPWGSDMYAFGAYTQKGNLVKITDTDYSFTVSDDGEHLISNRDMSVVYKRTQ